MTIYDTLWEIAEDNFGIVYSSDAARLGIQPNRLVILASRGKLSRIGHGVYQVQHHVPGPYDSFALNLAMVGKSAYLRGASVLGLLKLVPINLNIVYVGSTSRVRRKLPSSVIVKDCQCIEPVSYFGIRSESACQALASALADGALDVDRVLEAAENALHLKYITRKQFDCIRNTINHD